MPALPLEGVVKGCDPFSLRDKVNRRQAREGALGYKVNRRQARQGELRSKTR